MHRKCLILYYNRNNGIEGWFILEAVHSRYSNTRIPWVLGQHQQMEEIICGKVLPNHSTLHP